MTRGSITGERYPAVVNERIKNSIFNGLVNKLFTQDYSENIFNRYMEHVINNDPHPLGQVKGIFINHIDDNLDQHIKWATDSNIYHDCINYICNYFRKTEDSCRKISSLELVSYLMIGGYLNQIPVQLKFLDEMEEYYKEKENVKGECGYGYRQGYMDSDVRFIYQYADLEIMLNDNNYIYIDGNNSFSGEEQFGFINESDAKERMYDYHLKALRFYGQYWNDIIEIYDKVSKDIQLTFMKKVKLMKLDLIKNNAVEDKKDNKDEQND